MRHCGVRALLLASLVLSGPGGVFAEQSETARARRRTPVVDVFERCRDAVVNISTTRVQRVPALFGSESLFGDIFNYGPPRVRERRVHSVGSGVIVHEDGYIVTNAHVVAQTSDVRVIFADGEGVEATVVAADSTHDLAVLKVDRAEPLPCVKLGQSDDIMVGETVVAIGNPLGLQHTVTTGIVSAIGRELEFGRSVSYHGLIQTDAAINPGNSGGPLLNLNAELMGINTAIRGDAQNVGFAIPVSRLWEFLPSMLDIERRERVRFGLRVNGTDARVLQVREDSPADEAGLRPGDQIRRLGEATVRNGIDYYVHLREVEPGSVTRIGYERDGAIRSSAVELEIIPPPDGRALAREKLGLKLTEVDSAARRRYELPGYVGLVITEVEDRSPADGKGLRRGDVILRVDRMTAPSLNDLGLILENVQPREPIILEVLRFQRQIELWTFVLPAR